MTKIGREVPPSLFVRPEEKYDLDVNRILKDAGVESFPHFMRLVGAYIKGIPELHQVAEAAARIGAKTVLSGGSARAIIVALLKDVQSEGVDGELRPKRSLFEMMEGSDIDVLVVGKGGKPVSTEQLQKLQSDLNRISGAKLVEPLPSSQRRLYTTEWDVVEGNAFTKLNEAFGGETPSLFGLGLDEKGNLSLFDPHDALQDIFRGKFRYVEGEKPYEHEMVVRGQFDPALDGLRIIRMAGQMREVAVEPSDQALESLEKLGREANRRAWETQARFLHSPGGKLPRRWAKYTKKIWVDHKDPTIARQLLASSGYLEMLSLLGLRDYTLHELPAERPKRLDAHPAAQAFVKENQALFDGATKKGDQVMTFAWQSSRLAALALDEGRAFGADAGKFGPGLALNDTIPEGAIVTTQLRVHLKPDARVLDLTNPVVEDTIATFVARTAALFRPANEDVVVPLGDAATSAAWSQLLTALGVDAVVTKTGEGVVTNTSAIERFTKASGLDDGLIEDLRSKREGVNKEHAVRALIASQGVRGLKTLADLITSGDVPLRDLFPVGAPPGGLFADVPFVDPEFASRLAKAATRDKTLTQEQRDNVALAVSFMRADLPVEYQKSGT